MQRPSRGSSLRRDITWEIEAICAADAVANVAHFVPASPPRPRCWILDARELARERFCVRSDDRLQLVDFLGNSGREILGSAGSAEDIVFDAHANALPAIIDA